MFSLFSIRLDSDINCLEKQYESKYIATTKPLLVSLGTDPNIPLTQGPDNDNVSGASELILRSQSTQRSDW